MSSEQCNRLSKSDSFHSIARLLVSRGKSCQFTNDHCFVVFLFSWFDLKDCPIASDKLFCRGWCFIVRLLHLIFLAFDLACRAEPLLSWLERHPFDFGRASHVSYLLLTFFALRSAASLTTIFFMSCGSHSYFHLWSWWSCTWLWRLLGHLFLFLFLRILLCLPLSSFLLGVQIINTTHHSVFLQRLGHCHEVVREESVLQFNGLPFLSWHKFG